MPQVDGNSRTGVPPVQAVVGQASSLSPPKSGQARCLSYKSAEHGRDARATRDLEQIAGTPEFRRFVEARFPAQAPLLDNPVTRRRFCHLMGASLALAGLNGCDWPFWPEQKLAPEGKRPEGRAPGVPVNYATSFELGGVAEGLLVKCYDGRPIKVEGNPLHPINRGASSAFAQALVLELYDPDRSKGLVRRTGGQESGATWDEFAAFAKDLRARIGKGKGLHILSEASSSISLADMRARLLKEMPEASWYEYEPVSLYRDGMGTTRLCQPVYQLDKADLIVCLDEDLFGNHPDALKHARDFAARRNADGKMNRLIVFESGWTITGAIADQRTALKPSELEAFIRGPTLKGLVAGQGQTLIAIGSRLSAGAHTLVRRLSAELDNRNKAVALYAVETFPGGTATDADAIATLAAAMNKGEVDTLLILGGNPAYNAPADLEFVQTLKKVPHSIHLSLYEDETTRVCAWHLPRAHVLESWGDAFARDGTFCVQQPLIEPIYGGKTPAEVLALFLGQPPFRGYEIVRRAFKVVVPNEESWANWGKALHDGFLFDRNWLTGVKIPSEEVPPYETTTTQGLELLFVPDYRVYDGRFANNGWLQEMPDPITKLTWDNAAQISPETAKQQGVAHGDMVKLELDGRSLEIAVFVLPGIADGTVILPLGYGRKFGGKVADGVGFNTYLLRTTKAMYTASGARMTRTGATYKFATSQDHKIVSEVATAAATARAPELARSGPLSAYKANPRFPALPLSPSPPREGVGGGLKSPFTPPHQYTGHRWGMMIDLSVCTGCSACTVACQAENNVPVVGKDEVARGRRMQWLRVDRYFGNRPSPYPLPQGEGEMPALLFQPVPCMQCENAPCEEVCPVGATTHSSEGLNDMAYNRCVGTRYCSNNCPYKVRRFNWFNNHLNRTPVEKMAFNPEVTVRSRGVMEKCTYCVQRIEQARIAAKLARQPIADGAIVPACA
ncbi:MAG: TAT-variant-translocated molybdopterin oxidoreductase, partial [Planctomycetota bacterium]